MIARTATPTTKAQRWHRRPKNSWDRNCPICGAPRRCSGEHRAIAPSSIGNRRWQARTDDGTATYECQKHPTPKPQPPGTFEHAYQTQVRPKIKRPGTVHATDTVVSRFYLWRGGPTPLAEMSEGLLAQFGAALADSGATSETAANYPGRLRKILRQIDAKLCRPCLGWKKRDYKPGAPGTLSHFLELTYVPLRLLDAAPTTIQQHRVALDSLGRFLGREPLITDLSDDTLAGFMREGLQRGLSPVTVNGRRCYVTAWWRFAKRRGLLSVTPDVPKLKEFLREPCAWTIDDMARILASATREPGRVGGHPAGDWWSAFIETCYSTALRFGTMLRLRRENLNLKTGVLEVPGNFMKNRRGKKYILPPDALAALKAIWSPQPGEIFATHWKDPKSTYHAWRRILAGAGIEWKREHGFHMIRRTSATAVAVKGGMVAAMALLGHSEEYVTRRYVDPTHIPGHNVAAFLPPIPRPEPIAAAMRRKGGAA